jgi:hypothetical protein
MESLHQFLTVKFCGGTRQIPDHLTANLKVLNGAAIDLHIEVNANIIARVVSRDYFVHDPLRCDCERAASAVAAAAAASIIAAAH